VPHALKLKSMLQLEFVWIGNTSTSVHDRTYYSTKNPGLVLPNKY